ncbi:hypothetical protein ACFVBP_10380 [Nocardioides sp. NPDC057764]|uniref:hypothetical protein n=1 Tax=Nocardioides sp. NPDC057764 TaxID=3346243 RepID=UPI0036702318
MAEFTDARVWGDDFNTPIYLEATAEGVRLSIVGDLKDREAYTELDDEQARQLRLALARYERSRKGK